jgi:predicted RNA-binding Zn ribbon-like protein
MSAIETGKWKFVAGSICLNFTNTVGGRVWHDENNLLDYKILTDKLESFEDLIDWGKEIGFLNEASVKKINLFASQNEKAVKKIFQRAVALRESIYKIFISLTENKEPSHEDIDLLNSECAAAREKQKLYYDSNKFKWNFELQDTEQESIIWYVSLSAVELLVSEQLKRVKQCPGDNCGWLFLDSSKNGSRQWCDMKDCGNVAKVRRYRERQT